MSLRTTYFLALVLATIALIPAGAHLAELRNKIDLDASAYHTVQQIYRGWALFGIVIFPALAVTLGLAIAVRHHPEAFTPALVAFLCLAATQAIFWALTFPVNQATHNWTVMPANWTALRLRWEYSHAASAGLNFAAVVALILSLLRFSPVR